jgi:hypothetical protein
LTGIDTFGPLLTGDGNDSVTGIGVDVGIDNDSADIIDTGAGNDKILGSGTVGIFNEGAINTGAGNDSIDALIGGFDGDGFYGLGIGNDTLSGYNTGATAGFFDGGAGVDKLVFGPGTYTVSALADAEGFFTINDGATDMFVKNFELIASSANPNATQAFVPNTIYVFV